MISSEVQRTLVKSPPELWAELSDPTSLGRHLGELGDIQITAIEPETKVEWQAQDTSGTVVIKPSGWGTKVTLSVTRELTAVPEPAPEEPQDLDPSESAEQAAPEPEADSEPDVAASPDAAPEPEFVPGPEAVTESFDAGSEAEAATEPAAATDYEAAAEPKPEYIAEHEEPEATYAEEAPPVAELEPRRGFLARLFRRRAPAALVQPPEPIEASQAIEAPEPMEAQEPAAEHPDALATLPPTSDAQESEQPTTAIEALQARYLVRESGPAQPPHSEPLVEESPQTEAEAEAVAEPIASEAPAEPAGEAQPGTEVDIAAELRAAEEAATEEVTAVLTAALDRLGAAHHRPFSRS